jgi:hypothetical protein
MKKYLFSLFITVIGLLLVSSIFYPGWYTAHDGIFHIYRTEEALSMLKAGQFPLRWAGNFDQGFGIPLFTFIYPLPYYITSVFSYFVSSIIAVKILTVIAYLSGGLGIYTLFKKSGPTISVFLALIYLMTPYQFLNIFVRGALGEILALGIMPWVLVSFNHLLSTKKLSWYHPIPLFLLLISHNFLGILFGVFLLGYTLCQKSSVKPLIFSLLLSLGLAAFFLVPMIGEKNLLYSASHPDLNFRFDQHFVYFKQLLYSKWDYWYSVPGPDDGMSFQLGIIQLFLALVGTTYIIFNSKRTPSQIFLIVAYFGSVFLMLSKSFYIWKYINILQSIQFPWRFLFMPAILTPLLIYPLLQVLKDKKWFKFLLVILLLLNFANIRNYRRPMKILDLTEYTDLYRLYLNKTSTTFRSEILPKWGVENERYKSEDILVNSGNMIIELQVVKPLKIDITINNKPDESEGKVTILRNYFPGWVAKMDGKTIIKLEPTKEGMIYLYPEIGVHTYQISIKNTSLERIANLLSLGAIFGLIYLWQKNKKN